MRINYPMSSIRAFQVSPTWRQDTVTLEMAVTYTPLKTFLYLEAENAHWRSTQILLAKCNFKNVEQNL